MARKSPPGSSQDKCSDTALTAVARSTACRELNGVRDSIDFRDDSLALAFLVSASSAAPRARLLACFGAGAHAALSNSISMESTPVESRKLAVEFREPEEETGTDN